MQKAHKHAGVTLSKLTISTKLHVNFYGKKVQEEGKRGIKKRCIFCLLKNSCLTQKTEKNQLLC
jgi:hypothetical protein